MSTLGPYTLLRRLGAGGMGEVWIARREALVGASKLFAVKTVLPSKASNPDARRMFLDEARLSMLMTNSNIVQVFEANETADGTCYMAMEYVEGVDLSRLTEALRKQGEELSISAVSYIIGEVLKGLAYAHELDIDGTRHAVIHRDISPQNVMISRSGEVKIMDFGVARLNTEETSGSFVKGKLRYMPPEQFEKGARAPTIDLFAVGAILHELLDGRRFRGEVTEEPELVGLCVRGIVPPLGCPPERVPEQIEQLRAGLLEPNAAKRIPSARAAHRVLSTWPGNRDAKFELEELVSKVFGNLAASSLHLPSATGSGSGSTGSGSGATDSGSGSRSTGSSVTGSGSRSAGSGSGSNTVPTAVADPQSTRDTTGAGVDGPAQTESTELVESVEPTEMLDMRDVDSHRHSPSELRTVEPEPRDTRRRVLWVPLVLVILALGLGTFSAGIVFNWWGDDAVATESSTTVSAAAAPPTAPAEPEAAPTTPAPPDPAAPEPAPPDPAAPTEPAPAPDPAPAPEPAPPEVVDPGPVIKDDPAPAIAAKTRVTITASNPWAQVKIGRKELTLDRLAGKQVSTQLLPGKYAVSFRDDPEADWQSLGDVEIPEGGSVKLEIKAGKVILGK